MARFIREVRDTRYDLVIDFQGLLKSALWVGIARGTRKAGYGPGLRRDEKAWLVLDHRVPVTAPDAHAIERNLVLLEGLGIARQPLHYDLPRLPEHDAEARRFLADVGVIEGEPWIAINAMTRWPTKNWTPEGFAAVADALLERGLRAVFTGAPGDRAALDAIAAMARQPIARVDGRTGLGTLAALYRRASAVLSTDTGPMHLAVAVGTRVVALFGPTSPEYTGPFGPQHLVLRTGVGCSPCFDRTCRTTVCERHGCMRRLKIEAVVEAVVTAATIRKRPDGSDGSRSAQ